MTTTVEKPPAEPEPSPKPLRVAEREHPLTRVLAVPLMRIVGAVIIPVAGFVLRYLTFDAMRDFDRFVLVGAAIVVGVGGIFLLYWAANWTVDVLPEPVCLYREREDGSRSITDRTLRPLDMDTICESVKKTHRLLVAHDSWRTGSLGATIIAGVMERNFFDLDAPPLLVAPQDTPVPFAPELESVYRPNAETIYAKITELLKY